MEFVGVGFGGVKTRRVRYEIRMMAGKRRRVGVSVRLSVTIFLSRQSPQTLLLYWIDLMKFYLGREET